MTVVMEVRKLRARNTLKDSVKQMPIQTVAVVKVSRRTNGLRRTMSPTGQRKMRPAA